VIRALSRKARYVRANATALLLLAVGTAVAVPTAVAAQGGLDFEFYRENIEPVFTRPRGGYDAGGTACINCHTWQATTPLKLQPLQLVDGRAQWPEALSRRNFEVVSRLVVPGDPDASRLLRKPLRASAGGASRHTGGGFWESKDDPEWQLMAEWVRAAPRQAAAPAPPALDFQYFSSCVQPIFLNPIPGAVECTQCHAGGGNTGFARYTAGQEPFFTDAQTRSNFEALSGLIEPGYPEYSRFLHHPLHPDAGGDFMHNGGRRWTSKSDAEWVALAAWIRGEARGSTCDAALQF
jgi:mono/diheme cytochrome c family protein